MSATTVSTSKPVVSTTAASSAMRNGDAARALSIASRRSSAALTSSIGTSRSAADLVALPAPRPLVVAGDQEDLHRRVGEHHRADVAPLDDTAAVVRDPFPLAPDEDLPHRRMRGHRRHRGGHVGGTDGAADIAAVERGDTLFDRDRCGARRSPRTGPGRRAACRRSSTASVTARYIAPVSRTGRPRPSATPRATVDLPDPDGPSIAITSGRASLMRSCP